MKKVALILLSVCLAASTFFGVLFVTSGVREVSAGDATAAEDDRRSAAISQQVNLATGGAQIPDVSSARRVYYVDAENGDDNNSGDIDSPLRTLLRVNRLELEPGDQVRFKCGGTWYGELLIRHSGAEGSPIVYSSYGEGAKPVIDGRGEVQAAVYGEDVSYIVVEGLEVTNNSEVDDQLRSGIHFEAVWETIYNLKILNCYVHDVSGAVGGPFDELDNEAYGAYLENYSMESHHYGGIIVRAFTIIGYNEEVAPTFHNVLVQGNTVERCSQSGINIARFDWGAEKPSVSATNVCLRDNKVMHSAGDGLFVLGADGCLIEHNEVGYSAQYSLKDASRYFAGLWIIHSHNSLIQYNEVYGTELNGDAQGFDIDGDSTNTILQYNYSHDNKGGFLLLMCNNNGRSVVRYNISQNDGTQLVRIWESATALTSDLINQLNFYNNTLYSNQPLTTPVSGDYFAKVQLDTHPQEMWKKALGRNWKFRNNIFYLTGPVSGEFDQDWAYADWQSNCFYGFPETAIPDDPTRITEDPQFVAPGEASFGFDSLSAYVLKTTSPCLNAGVPIGVRGVKDIFGNPIDASTGCNIGAYMGTGTDMQQSHNIALNTDVTASSAEGNSVYTRQTYMKNVTNGELDDLYLSGSELTENHTEWVEIDFGASFDVKSVVVYGAADGTLFPSRFKLLAWDGSEWKEVGSEKNFKREKTDSGQIQGTWTLEGVNTSKIRFEATSLETNEDGEYRLALAEIQAFN